jgi:glycerol-3-phosphate dehydrogenase (NAD(P)+)
VMLQWEWLGGLPPLRRAAVIGAGPWGSAMATMLARAGLDVDVGVRSGELELSRHDLVCFAVPAAELPAAVAEHAATIPRRAGVLVLSKGLVGPLGTLPGAYVAERTEAWATGVVAGPASAAAVLDGHASLVVAAADPAFRRQVTEAFTSAGFDALGSADVVGVELAGCARDAAALAAATAAHAGRAAAGSAAGKVFAEVDAYAHREGSAPGTFAGLAGAGDLVATVMAEGSRNRRAGEMLAEGMPAEDIDSALGQTAEAVACVPLLAERVQAAGVDAPTLRGLAGVIEGELDAAEWTESLTAPRPTPKRPQKVRAA